MISAAELEKFLKEHNQPAFRAKQILQAFYEQGADSYQQIKNLPKTLIQLLEEKLPIYSVKKVIEQTASDQTTTKTLFELSDGKKVEAVLMNFKDGRHSVCVSSQAGCQLGCKFCATGTLKFGRNLTANEIADQISYFAQKLLREKKRISNVVFMGMGEPFMNYENVISSIKMLNDKNGLNIGARRITLSTAGICEGIAKLADEPLQVNLAVSLHAPNQAIRGKIMPIARRYNINQLIETIQTYLDKTHRRVSYEYVMLKGINDLPEHAQELNQLLHGQLCHVNLIPYNAADIPNITGSEKSSIQKFAEILKKNGIQTTIRVTIGQEIDAACGQLANKSEKI